MTLLRNAYQALFKASSSAPALDRLPLTPVVTGGWLTGEGSSPGARIAQMQAYSSVGWLFATVSRIAQAVAAVEWQLYRGRGESDPLEIKAHPLLDLWNDINLYDTRETFLELSQQHLELTGEAWWLVIRDSRGVPQELWAVRPDRMRPVPDRDKFIAGYIYTIGAERIPLEVDDVIFLRLPSPLDPYRGAGPVQSLLVDIGGEAMAAQWNRNFYRNSAEPGGIIELSETVSDAQFEVMRQRWAEQHQGVGNAHRVAILEHGKWVDRKYTQRDMQYEQLRHLNRDLILGAFGMPLPLLGIVESVNRANAEAADLMFSRWVVRPRLERIKQALNVRLAPMFDPTLFFDYIDPTPENREQDLAEAERGYKAGFLTRNEARQLVNQDPVPDGEDFAPSLTPFNLGVLADGPLPPVSKALVEKAASPLDRAEARMRGAWTRRLKAEADALGDYLAQFMSRSVRAKIELADIAGYSWDWWQRYGDNVVAELTEAFTASMLREFPAMPPNQAQRLATEYAQHRGARLLRLDGDLNMVNFTRQRVNQLVAQTIEQGDSLGQLQKALREDVAFSRERARAVARTETATAQGQGARGAAIAQGRDEKAWITQGDDLVEEDCISNEAAGWIALGDPFPTGVDTIPQHPNCRCVVRYRTAELREESTQSRRICPDCGKATLVMNREGPGYWCRRCAKVVIK